MEDFNIHHAGVYTRQADSVKSIGQLDLCFAVSGMRHFRRGKCKPDISKPFCHLAFPGDVIAYKYDENRKNWSVQFTYPGIKRISENKFSFSCGGKSIILPRHIEITQDDLAQWRKKFDQLLTMSMASTPHEQTLAQLCLLDIFKSYIETADRIREICPAAKLKQLIDMPENAHFSLSELSTKCGYSVDHLRVLFNDRYRISPVKYRIASTMSHAMKLICTSNTLVSDVAVECGFDNLSHFSRSFKKVHGISPSEALKRFRYQ